MMVPGPNISNLFDVSYQLDMSSFRPLDFNINGPNFSLDSSVNEHSRLLLDGGNDYPNQMTSTPYKPKDVKDKERGENEKEKSENEESQEASVQITVPKVVDETIFHANEKSPKLASPLDELGQSLSFGQTIFSPHATEVDNSSATPDNVVTSFSTEHKPASSES